jgi:hypothetical protein
MPFVSSGSIPVEIIGVVVGLELLSNLAQNFSFKPREESGPASWRENWLEDIKTP